MDNVRFIPHPIYDMSEKGVYYNCLTIKSCELSQKPRADASDIADARLLPAIIDTVLDRHIEFEKVRTNTLINRKVLCGVIFEKNVVMRLYRKHVRHPAQTCRSRSINALA